MEVGDEVRRRRLRALLDDLRRRGLDREDPPPIDRQKLLATIQGYYRRIRPGGLAYWDDLVEANRGLEVKWRENLVREYGVDLWDIFAGRAERLVAAEQYLDPLFRRHTAGSEVARSVIDRAGQLQVVDGPSVGTAAGRRRLRGQYHRAMTTQSPAVFGEVQRTAPQPSRVSSSRRARHSARRRQNAAARRRETREAAAAEQGEGAATQGSAIRQAPATREPTDRRGRGRGAARP